MIDLGTTNVWLGIIAIVSLLELVALATAGLIGFRVYRSLTSLMQEFERRHVAPISAEVQSVLHDVHGLVERVQHFEDALSDTAHRAAATTRRRTWPLRGLIRALRAGVAALGSERPARSHV